MQVESKIRICIADDEVLFRAGLARLLHELGAEVEILEAGDFATAHRLVANEHALDALLLDLDLLGVQPDRSLHLLRQAAPDLAIVICSASEDPNTVFSMIDGGAVGYLPKTSSTEVTLSAVRLVLSGGSYVPPSVFIASVRKSGARVRFGMGEPPPDLVDPQNRVAALTPRQLEVLKQIGKSKTNKQIAVELGLAEGTVKAHVNAILAKLGVRNRTAAGILAHRSFAEEP